MFASIIYDSQYENEKIEMIAHYVNNQTHVLFALTMKMKQTEPN